MRSRFKNKLMMNVIKMKKYFDNKILLFLNVKVSLCRRFANIFVVGSRAMVKHNLSVPAKVHAPTKVRGALATLVTELSELLQSAYSHKLCLCKQIVRTPSFFS